MSTRSECYSGATIFQRVQMIEQALEKVLDRGPEMSVEAIGSGESMHVFVISEPWSDERLGHSLHDIARELEMILP